MTSNIQIILLVSIMVVFLPACSKNQSNKTPDLSDISEKNRNSSQEIFNDQISDNNETIVKINPVADLTGEDNSETTAIPEVFPESEIFDSEEASQPMTESDSPFPDENIEISKNEEDDQEVFEIQEVADVKREVKVQNLSRQNQDFLPYTGTQVVYPEDYLIGSLYNPAESSLENQSVAKTTEEFLAQLKQSILNEKVIESGSITKIRSLVTNILEKQINLTSYRIGVLTTEEQQSRVNIRLWSTLSTVEGELYLTKIDNKWYVEDLQANIMELAIKNDKEENVYMPSSYEFQ